MSKKSDFENASTASTASTETASTETASTETASTETASTVTDHVFNFCESIDNMDLTSGRVAQTAIESIMDSIVRFETRMRDALETACKLYARRNADSESVPTVLDRKTAVSIKQENGDTFLAVGWADETAIEQAIAVTRFVFGDKATIGHSADSRTGKVDTFVKFAGKFSKKGK